jgi:hypothetical protein
MINFVLQLIFYVVYVVIDNKVYYAGSEVLTAVAVNSLLFYHLRYNAVQSGESQPTFRRNIWSPSSGSGNKPRKKSRETGGRPELPAYL